MFKFKSMLPLLLAVSLPFGSAAPTDNAAPAAHAFLLGGSADSTANFTSDAVTTNPAVEFAVFDGTSCGGEGIVYEFPDATCFGLEAGSLDIFGFFGNCRFMRVWSGSSCSGSSADLGIIDKCWSVNTRNSFQIYC